MKLLFILLLSVPVTSFGQIPTLTQAAFDTFKLKAHVITMASDSFQGRQPFTLGETRTLNYLADAFMQMKLEAGNGNSYLQEVPIVQSKCEVAPAMAVKSGNKNFILQNSQDYAIYSFSPDSIVSLQNAETVFAGYGIVAPAYNRNDFSGIDVKGKVVLVLMNERGQKKSFLDSGRTVTYYETNEYKIEEAARQGAKGCFLVQPVNAAASLGRIQANLNQGKMYLNGTRYCPIMGFISRATLNKLLKASGIDSTLIVKAAENAFKPVTLNVQFSTSLKVNREYKKTWNVIAKITGAKKPGECVVYSAHWDHLGIGQPDANGDSIYNGASDNAIGVAALLELARAFKISKDKPGRTIIFLCAGAEEMGHLGSLWYTYHAPYPLDKIVANINMDGFNRYGKTKDLVIVGSGRTDLEDYLKKEVIRQGRYISPDPQPEQGNYFGSDQLSFAKAGVPSLFLFRGVDYVNGGKAYEETVRKLYYAYHTPSDEYNAGWRFDGTIEDMHLLLNLGQALANKNLWPKWNKYAEFIR